MKHFCVKNRKRYKREQLDKICTSCKFEKCHMWWDYNEKEQLPENIVNSNILNLDEIQKTKLRLDFRNITGKEL